MNESTTNMSEKVYLTDITKVGEYLGVLAQQKADAAEWLEKMRGLSGELGDSATIFLDIGEQLVNLTSEMMDMVRRTAAAQIAEAKIQLAEAERAISAQAQPMSLYDLTLKKQSVGKDTEKN